MNNSGVENICTLCNGLKFEVVEDCGKGFNVLRCLNCGLAFVSPMPMTALLTSAYTEDYYIPWIKEQRSRRTLMWMKRLKALNSLSSNKKGKLLDVGCAEGLFLELAKKDGWDVTGTEISSFAVAYGKEEFGLDILQGELMDIGFPDKTFDAVTMWHVLEHTINPIVVLKEIRRILRDDGEFLLAVPNLNNILSQWVYRLVKGRRMHLFDPEDRELHLYHFTPATIRLALEKAGFRVEKIIPDMGIVQWHMRILNHVAKAIGLLPGRIITDAMEVHARPI
ncbi:MAG: class I SAM-dependent methyltransferase [Nitrospirota bacterium]|nr:class I SAM-dependent methyltransferase [Nitrospirota bacterium]